MRIPAPTPPVYADPPATTGAAFPAANEAMQAGPSERDGDHAWADQAIDIAGTEADPAFTKGDHSV